MSFPLLSLMLRDSAFYKKLAIFEKLPVLTSLPFDKVISKVLIWQSSNKLLDITLWLNPKLNFTFLTF